MNNFIEHKNIKLNLLFSEQPTEIKGKGWAHPAQIVGHAVRDQLQDLLSLILWGEPVIAVESFAVVNQTDKPISLLLKSKKW